MKKNSGRKIINFSIVPLRFFGFCFIILPIYFLIKELWPLSIKDFIESFNEYKSSLKLSMEYGLWTCAINLIISIPAAWFIYRKRESFFEKFFSVLLIIPLFGGIYVAFGFFYIFSKGGIVNWLFSLINIDTIRMLYSPISIIVAMTILTLPFMLNAIMNSINKIPGEHIFAARILGAKEWVILRRIVLPQTVKGIFAGLLMTLGWTLSVVEIPLLLGNFPFNEVFSVRIFRNITTYYEYRQSAYISLFVISCILAMSITAKFLEKKQNEI